MRFVAKSLFMIGLALVLQACTLPLGQGPDTSLTLSLPSKLAESIPGPGLGSRSMDRIQLEISLSWNGSVQYLETWELDPVEPDLTVDLDQVPQGSYDLQARILYHWPSGDIIELFHGEDRVNIQTGDNSTTLGLNRSLARLNIILATGSNPELSNVGFDLLEISDFIGGRDFPERSVGTVLEDVPTGVYVLNPDFAANSVADDPSTENSTEVFGSYLLIVDGRKSMEMTFISDIGHPISFFMNGGEEMSELSLPSASLVRPQGSPYRDGYQFVGWFMDEELTIPWDIYLDKVEGPLTLYASWI